MLARNHIKMEGTRVYSGGLGVKGGKDGKIEAKKVTTVTAAGTFAKAQTITVDNTSAITNKTYAHANVPWPPFEAYSGGHATTTVSVPDGATWTLPLSVYKEVRVGKNATAIFTQPVVDIEKALKLGDGATIKFTQCAKVHLDYKLEAGKNVNINPDSLSVIFYINHDVKFKEGAHVYGVLYLGAPNTTDTVKHHLHVDESRTTRPGIFRGMFLAECIHSGKNNYWYLNPICNFCSPSLPKAIVENELSQPVIGETTLRNYPNPFSNKTNLIFLLQVDDHVNLEVFDLSGKMVRSVYNGDAVSGQEYVFEVDATELPTGIYIYKMTTSSNVVTGKMILSRE
jgi:hypothetical protein